MLLIFGEVSYPMSPKEEREWLNWKLDNGIMSRKDLLLYFNPDMTDEELESKLSEVAEENRVQAEASKPTSTFQKILNGSGTTSS